MMAILSFLTNFFRKIGGKRDISAKVSDSPKEASLDPEPSIYQEKEPAEEVYNLWDYLEFQANTQAYYLAKVLGFEEWITMDEVRRRIQELFGVSYRNEKSLYAYIKTLVDCGLLETTNAGGKRTWRKKDLLIRIKKKKELKEKETALQVS